MGYKITATTVRDGRHDACRRLQSVKPGEQVHAGSSNGKMNAFFDGEAIGRIPGKQSVDPCQRIPEPAIHIVIDGQPVIDIRVPEREYMMADALPDKKAL